MIIFLDILKTLHCHLVSVVYEKSTVSLTLALLYMICIFSLALVSDFFSLDTILVSCNFTMMCVNINFKKILCNICHASYTLDTFLLSLVEKFQ